MLHLKYIPKSTTFSTSTCNTLTQATIFCCLDYCQSFLTDLPTIILNTVTTVILLNIKVDVTSQLKPLQMLLTLSLIVKDEVLTNDYKAPYNVAPAILLTSSYSPACSLDYSYTGLIAVCKANQAGTCLSAFAFAVSAALDAVPSDVHMAHFFTYFRNLLRIVTFSERPSLANLF